MEQVRKISLLSLVLININIMVGSGVFINTSLLTKFSGSLSAFTYALVGILLLPLVLVIIQAWKLIKGPCTFYHLGLPVSPFWGFLSIWSYAISKPCSFALGIHICISFLQQIIPLLSSIETIYLDLIVLIFFIFLNLLNLRLNQSIQYSFLGLKLIPIFFAIISGFFLFSPSNFSPETFLFKGIPTGIPLVLFAFAGFESTCSLSQLIENPEKNGPRAILISYFLAISLVILFQLILYTSMGMELGTFERGYLDVFPAFLSKLFANKNIQKLFIVFFNIAIASSSLGSAYGIIFGNSWNLFTLAKEKHILGSKIFSRLNKHHVPFACILLQGLLAIIYLLLTGARQIPLQQVAALGIAIAYLFTAISFIVLSYRKKTFSTISFLSLISCILLISSFIWQISVSGISFLLVIFLGLLLFGSYMFFQKHKSHELDVFDHL